MMKDILVTVIIPVYKAEKTLQECLDSVLVQNYPNLEVILVDDGSPDICPALCDRYAIQYENVHAIHQKNQGSGIARNTGLTSAKGKYVLFVDSDDCLDGKDAVNCMVRQAEEKRADIVVGSFRRFWDGNVSEKNYHHLQEGEYSRTVDFRFKGFYMYGHLAYDWGKLYRRRFLTEHDLKCRAYPFTQDKAHNMACYVYKPVYAFVPESVYLYRVNEESVTFRYKEDLIPVWISIATDFRDFLKERGIRERYWDLMAFHIFFGAFFLAKQELQFKKHGIREAERALRCYGENSFVKKAMSALAHGKYIDQIEPVSWKIVIRMAAMAFSVRAYGLLTLGIALLRKLEIDQRITKKRYQKG